MPRDVNGHYRKPQGPIRMILEEGHRNENFLWICGHSWTCSRTIRTGFTDDKDASRTMRMRFTVDFWFPPPLGKLPNDAFIWTKAYIRGTWFGYCSFTSCISMRIHQFNNFTTNTR